MEVREIKFRLEIENIYTGQIQIMVNSIFDLQNGLANHDLGKDWKIISYSQSTGIKDRNGVEIFEGDIVNYAIKRKLCDCKDSPDLFLGISKFCPDCGKPLEDKDFVTKCEIRFMNGSFVLYKLVDDDYYTAWATYIAETYIEWMEVTDDTHRTRID